MSSRESFGRKLRMLRDTRGLTQDELAAMVGIDRSYISRIERGKAGPPSLDVIRALARALETDADDLLAAALYPEGRREGAEDETELFLNYYRNMTPEERANVLEFMEFVRSRRRRPRRAGGENEGARSS